MPLIVLNGHASCLTEPSSFHNAAFQQHNKQQPCTATYQGTASSFNSALLLLLNRFHRKLKLIDAPLIQDSNMRKPTLGLMFTFAACVSARTSTRHLERDDITGHIPSTRQEVLARREERSEGFRERLVALYAQLEEHEQGILKLYPGEKIKIEKAIKAYEAKLGHYKNTSERHIDRLLEREDHMNEMHRRRILKSAGEL